MATANVRFLRNSETGAWRDCKLKWYFYHFLGFKSSKINKHFWLGTFIHHALSEWYLGNCSDPTHLFWMCTEEWLESSRGVQVVMGDETIDYNPYEDLEEYQRIGMAMLEGYVEWAATNDDFDVLDSEHALYIPMETFDGEQFTFVCRLDMLTENSEGIRTPDFKTAGDFRDADVVHTFPQFRRYPMAVQMAHPEWADEVIGSSWIALRKIAPSGRSKPPYFMSLPIDLTPEQLQSTYLELRAEATDIISTEHLLSDTKNHREIIYPTPTSDCKWKCEFFSNGLCHTWRSMGDVAEQGLLHGSWDNSHYAEYHDDYEESILTIGQQGD